MASKKNKATKDKMTPLMRQHFEIKSKYPDAVLLFRVGDFYETFGEDAIIASRVLGIVQTKRSNGAASHVELAGFPHHSLDAYLHKLVKAGYRVAICDQLEQPSKEKKIVKRGVTEVVTPGVTLNDKLLQHDSNNFLASKITANGQAGLALVDISTGEFFLSESSEDHIQKLLPSFSPSELIVPSAEKEATDRRWKDQTFVYSLHDWIYDYDFAYGLLTKLMGTQNLKGYSVEDLPLAISAAGAIVHYLQSNELENLSHINKIHRIVDQDYLWMDGFTIQNLELLTPLHGPQSDAHSLYSVINNTETPLGARLLRRWICFPLSQKEKIQQRQNAVGFFIAKKELRTDLKSSLEKLGDPERLVSKIPLGKINPREVWQLKNALECMERVKKAIVAEPDKTDYLNVLADQINPLVSVQEKISHTLAENAPAQLSKGEIICEGVSEELDEYKKLRREGKDYLIKLQERESEKTGISSLKIGFNNVFGYYLEVTKAHQDKVPEEWMRKQTLTNSERYITPELKEYEEKIAKAEENISSLELQIYQELVASLSESVPSIQASAHSIAIIDNLLSMANTAIQQNYVAPELHDGLEIEMKAARHPVIESILPLGEDYIPNDIYLDQESQQIIILTGPNMSGKSALLRQTALITLMAHMGGYVPCSSAKIAMTDKIFTRVGASDNLSAGESTFMVEMNETAGILNNISPRSLILLDEIGRGTSTYDGISLAWSIVEFLHDCPEKPKTLFATHYHELNDIAARSERVKNFHIGHADIDDQIVFTRKLERGGSNHSFGIHVAKMAGIPQSILSRAQGILKSLEEQAAAAERSQDIVPEKQNIQLSFFDSLSDDMKQIQNILEQMDVNTITPVEALLKISEMKKILSLSNSTV